MLSLVILGFVHAARANGQTTEVKAQLKPLSLNNLSIEVNALQALHQLQLDSAQLEKLQKWAEESAAKDQQRKPAKASAAYRDKLATLRKALQGAKDGDLIASLPG
jgi:hypothetical protein